VIAVKWTLLVPLDGPRPSAAWMAFHHDAIQVDSHLCKIKRRFSFLSNFAQSVPENGAILFYLAETYNSGRRQGVL
jgi:hypothetical protein